MNSRTPTPHQLICRYILSLMLLMLVGSSVSSYMQLKPFLRLYLGSVVPVVLVLLLFIGRSKIDLSLYFPVRRISFQNALAWILFGVTVHACGIFINLPMQMLCMQFDVPAGAVLPEITDVAGYLTSIVCTAVLPAVLEEMFCRGIVLNSYAAYGKLFAVWASTAVFCILHLSIVSIPFTLFLGLVLSVIALQEESLIPAMLVHFSVNFCSCTYAFLTRAVIPAWLYTDMSVGIHILFALLLVSFFISAVWYAKRRRLLSFLRKRPAEVPRLGLSLSAVFIVVVYFVGQLDLILK